MRRVGGIVLGVLAACFAAPAFAQDPLLAAAAATEFREICREDRSRLWGVDMCGPLLIVDPASRGVWASEPDTFNTLIQSGSGWTGTLPSGVPIANTSVDWAGQRWIMVLAPLPHNAQERRVLLAHEAWHRAQDRLSLAPAASDCSHLDQEEARVLMRLEFRALGTALRSRGAARRQAAREALMFRAARFAAFPNAAAQEAALDRNEGLAAYTGVVLGARDNPDLFAARTLDSYDAHEALARSYAYASGPAYGLLLDDYVDGWRRNLGGYAPADLLQTEIGAADARDQRIAARFNRQAIVAEERARADARRARLAELQTRFGRGQRLELPLRSMQMEFDPNQVTAVEGLGSFYGVITLRDVWGEIVAEQGALISSDFTRLTAATPAAGGLSGPGWRLRLAPGYQLIGPDADGVIRLIEIPADAPEQSPPT